MSDGIYLAVQKLRPMAKKQAVAALFKNAALRNACGLAGSVPRRTFADHRALYGWLLDSRHFAKMFSMDGVIP